MDKAYTLNEYIELINENLEKEFPCCDFGYSDVHDAMKYSLKVGGKRIRPVLVLEFCRVCGGDINDALPFALAIEMIHTYSLIHDDLPCMDDDDMRRGKPSCHIKFGEEFALLAGDGLLTLAFNIIAKSSVAKERPEIAVKAIEFLSGLAGVNGMIGGQAIDLKNENQQADLETLKLMDTLKTGALIKCAAMMGAVCANACQEKLNAAETYAENLGLAFQIVDDILDVVGDEVQLGKPIGSDCESKKSTYVSVLGLEKSSELANELTRKAIDALDLFGDDGKFLKDLAFSLIKRQN